MKALPAKYAEIWRKAASDPDGVVEYLITPPGSLLMNMLGAKYGEQVDGEFTLDTAGVGIDLLAYTLKGIRGLDGFTLEFVADKLSGRKIQRVPDSCLERIPPELLNELLIAAQSGATVTPEESDNLAFTPASPAPESVAAETRQAAIEVV